MRDGVGPLLAARGPILKHRRGNSFLRRLRSLAATSPQLSWMSMVLIRNQIWRKWPMRNSLEASAETGGAREKRTGAKVMAETAAQKGSEQAWTRPRRHTSILASFIPTAAPEGSLQKYQIGRRHYQNSFPFLFLTLKDVDIRLIE